MTQDSARERDSQHPDAKRALARAAELHRRARRLTKRANRFRRLAELLAVAQRNGLHPDALRAALGEERFNRMMQEGARIDDLTIMSGAVRERERLARIARAFPSFAGGTAYPVALKEGR